MLYESNHYTGELVLLSVCLCCGEILCVRCQILTWNNRHTYWNLMKKELFSYHEWQMWTWQWKWEATEVFEIVY